MRLIAILGLLAAIAAGATFALLQAVYDARIVHGPAMTVLDGIDCRSAECKAEVPLAALTVSFPGKASIHTYVRMDDARTTKTVVDGKETGRATCGERV